MVFILTLRRAVPILYFSVSFYVGAFNERFLLLNSFDSIRPGERIRINHSATTAFYTTSPRNKS